MNIVRYEPWNLVRKFQHDVNRLLNDRFVGETTAGSNANAVSSHWYPAVDIMEEDDRFVLTADLPGVDPEQIEITTNNGVLTIQSERLRQDKDEHKKYRRLERLYGSFNRRFRLPDSVDANRISAKNHNGVLEVSIPKKNQVKPRRIAIAA